MGQLTLRPATTPFSFENVIKLKNGHLNLVEPLLGRGAIVIPHFFFLDPGGIALGLAQAT
jgi:hypothetical protein